MFGSLRLLTTVFILSILTADEIRCLDPNDRRLTWWPSLDRQNEILPSDDQTVLRWGVRSLFRIGSFFDVQARRVKMLDHLLTKQSTKYNNTLSITMETAIKMTISSMPKLVLVTGANGYIASSLIQSLLEQGYRVRGTVRDVSNESKVTALKAMPNASTHLELVPLELTGPQEAFNEALREVEWVFHTASPVIIQKVKDEEKLIEPALHGTLNMFRAANATPTVRKFILTSSIASIGVGHGNTTDTFTENDWTNLCGPNVNTYAKSKTLSEQAAWEFMKLNNPSFTLSVMNPAIVLGPLPSEHVSGSVEFLVNTLDGTYRSTINLFLPLVDIRNVVEAHIQAAKIPEAAGKRFILCQSDGGEVFLPDVCATLKQEFGPMGYEISARPAPKWFVWLLSWINPLLADRYHTIDKREHYDNSRSREILHLEYIQVEQTIVDCGYSLIEKGIVPAKPGYKSRKHSLK